MHANMLRGVVAGFLVVVGIGYTGLVAGCFRPALEQLDGIETNETIGDGANEVSPDNGSETSSDDGSDALPEAADTSEVFEEIGEEVDGADADVGPVGPAIPTGLTASQDRSQDVWLSWSGVASAYRVFRCDGDPCAGFWFELTTTPVTETSYSDTGAEAAGLPGAPVAVVSGDLPDRVALGWGAVVAPEPPRYSYRVTAVEESAESPPSAVAIGRRAGRPVVGYEVRVGDGAWTTTGPGTTWDDTAAGPPSVTIGAVTASEGSFAGHVALSATGVGANPGPTRTYRVRAVTDYGPGPASDEVAGWRSAGALTLQWYRSVGPDEEAFEPIGQATELTADDIGAPSDGSVRYYRLAVSAPGASTQTSTAVAGWRQPPPGVPGGVAASSNVVDRIRVTWQEVSGAIGYHVYRGETKLTTGTGLVATTFEDFDAPAPTGEWAAPSGLGASTNLTDGIELSWVAPVRPMGALTNYRVSAHNAAGEGALSATASGRRAAPALESFEVEVGPPSGLGGLFAVESTITTWLDEEAPLAQIAPGTITATQGDHRRHVRLTHTGASITPAGTEDYRVRGRLVGGGYTPWSTIATGRRSHGTALTRHWQRSPGSIAQGFANLTSTAASTYDDLTAASQGTKHWYRLSLTAAGAEMVTLEPVDGWRLAFASIAAGDNFTCARTPLDADGGRVWCWGANGSGQLGRGHTNYEPSPRRIEGLTDVRELASGPGALHVCARRGDSTLWCWGQRHHGQIGDGSSGGVRAVPTVVPGLQSQAVKVGGVTTCSRLLGTVSCWGGNFYGQVGAGLSSESQPSPSQVRTSSGNLSAVRQFGVGDTHACATRRRTGSEDELWCWGFNESHQLGATSPTTSAVAIRTQDLGDVLELATGGHTSCVRLLSGQVQCWGSNWLSALGAGAQPLMVADPVELVGLSASQLALGMHFGCARSGSGVAGKIRCWGHNHRGQLGNGSTVDSDVPVDVLAATGSSPFEGASFIATGSDHACLITADATAHCWGDNGNQRLGVTSSVTSRPSEVALP